MGGKSAPKILVLDDEPFMLTLIIQTLAGLGFSQVMGCGNGLAALELVNRPSSLPDIVLCDLNMPEMDGIEFLRNLADYNYIGGIILISGESERTLLAAEKLVQAHHFALLGHLRKPALPAALAALLEKWSPGLPIPLQGEGKIYDAKALRAALAGGELVNYYQPQVAVASGRVIGVETLVRWRHPEDGMVLPDQFIGIAEKHGLIDELTRIVLCDALAQARIWQDAGLALRVGVNVSMGNLAALEFADFVAGQAAAAGVAPQDVVLEVTESLLMQDQRAPLEILTRLRLKRFRLSIDDFGTGHSSLSQLRDIPFDELKIDRGFVHGAWANETAQAIYIASCGLAKQLGMNIVAEGGEDRDDWDFLRRMGCDIAQGDFIARPMPAADLLGWVKTWQAREWEWGGNG